MPCLQRLGKALAGALLIVVAVASHLGAPRAQDGESAQDIFRDYISGPIVQSRCVNCHVEGGVSGHTRLVLVRSTQADHEALNLRAFEELLDAVADDGGASYVLNKIQGVSHGGGVQVAAGSADFVNMQRFLGRLDGGSGSMTAELMPGTLFDTVRLAPDWKTLRRAALIFAGRIPTAAEYAAVESGRAADLRATIRGLMRGDEFHEFLIRGSNDRLLTDRESGGFIDDGAFFVDHVNEHYRRKKAAQAIDDEHAWHAFHDWQRRVSHGARRAPLELIAYVVMNERPYTEILTADYVMANPWAARAYGASTRFNDPGDANEFRPSRIAKYYRDGDGIEYEYFEDLMASRVINPGPLRTVYPHAGILNTLSFLQRYPTTATNRNRARARWTYYHFLGLDVEKSASRTTDPVALADTNNPTMHNPACTVCHSVLDPVAGAFQNYDEEGRYKSQWGGVDSLDDFYKYGDEYEHAWAAARETFEITARSRRDAHTLSITAMLKAGTEVLDLSPRFDPPRPHDSEIWWHMGIDHVAVRDADGDVVRRLDLKEVAGRQRHDGMEPHELDLCGPEDQPDPYYASYFCSQIVRLDIPEDGIYDVEVVVWADSQHREVSTQRLLLDLSLGGYVEGDVWYRDMRTPGFADAAAPDSDDSLQWLARRIVADPRFAEAAVKFWWPAIMGSEVAEFPEDERDADFEGRLLAANAQDAEVRRLANGFRGGFHGGRAHNLKDLLVEIVLSKWFRVDTLRDADPVRRAALRDAGARRLLTPEELARKTVAVTGYQWGRHIRTGCYPECDATPNSLTDEYRMLYGGIDSDGIPERARDVTSVMAGVATRHAVEASCPIVMRELYLLTDRKRRLFAGVDPYVTPTSEFTVEFEIEAGSQAGRETLSLSGELTPGSRTVRVSFTNDYWDEDRGDRNVRLDRLDVRNAAGRVVTRYELERLAPATDCNRPVNDHFALYCAGSVDIPIEIAAGGNYAIEVIAWADQAGDELPRLRIAVESDTQGSSGATAIRGKLVELHDKLLGVRVTPDSPDVEAAYRLFVDVWQRKRHSDEGDYFRWLPCSWDADLFFYEGILEDALMEGEDDWGPWQDFDWDRVNDFLDGIDFSDPHYTAQAWVVVLAAMMMDYRYLYL